MILSEKRRDNKGRILKDGESQRKDGRYQYRYKDLDGKRRCIYNLDLHALRKEEDEINRYLGLGVSYQDGCAPLRELLDRLFWLKRNWTDSTRKTMEQYRVTISKSHLYETPINRIKVSDIKAYLIGLHDANYAHGTIAAIFSILKMAFRLAVDDNAIMRDPCNFPLSDILRNETPPVRALSVEQEQALLAFLREDTVGNRYYDMVVVLLGTGLRISEFAALTMKDIDFKHNLIHVNKQLVRLKGKVTISRTKSRRSNRDIPMTTAVKESLERMIAERKQNPKNQTIDGIGNFLTVSTNGKPRTHSQYADLMRTFMTRYQSQATVPIERCTPHVLRHTYCTRCIAAGMDVKSVQYLMGHANATTTLNIYADTVFDRVVENMTLLDRSETT